MGRNNIKAICQLKKYSEIYNAVILVLSLTVGIILELIFRKSGMDETYMGDVIAVAVGFGYALINLFIKIFVLADEVPRGLSFGMTRKALFGYSRLVDLIEIIIFAIIAAIASASITLGVIFKSAALMFGVIMWIEALAGNGMLRYGKVVYWIYYIFFMVVMLGGPRVIESVTGAADGAAALADMFINPFYNQLPVWSCVIAFAVIGLIINWLTFRKIPVNFSL